jgi:hypothetical protein
MNRKIKIAVIKHAGLCIGGSELWLQKLAAHLPKDKFEVDFYYCDDCPHIGGEHIIQKSSEERGGYLENNGVNLIKFKVGAKNIKTLTNDWVDTDFWEIFDENKYDLIQTVKAGPREYPFYKFKKPVVEIVGLALRPDNGKNIAWSWHSSPWQRAQWVRLGGRIDKSSVLTCPIETPETTEDYRKELGIPSDAIITGFHQRSDNLIASPIPLNAFSRIQKKYPEDSANWHFIIKNGAQIYREQAKRLGINNVHFLPATSDYLGVSKFLNTIDFFSHGRKDGETFGAVFIEAMIHGRPCLTHYSADGGNASPETIGPAGLFAKDEDEYVDYLYDLFKNNELREKLSSKAKPHAEEYFSIEKCIDQAIEVYNRIVGLPDQDKNKKVPIPYYYSDLEFIYASNFIDLKDENDIAYRSLIGGIPREFECRIVEKIIANNVKSFKDFYPGNGLFTWLICKKFKGEARIKVEGVSKSREDEFNKTIYLNNWEGFFNSNDDEHASLVRIGSKDDTKIEVDMDTMLKKRDIFFIDNKQDKRQYLEKLSSNGYFMFSIFKNKIKIIEDVNAEFSRESILALPNEMSSIKNNITELGAEFRAEKYYLNLVEKFKVINLINKIIPPYITPKRVTNYLKRKVLLILKK